MELHLFDSAKLSWVSSSFMTSTTCSTKVLTEPRRLSTPPRHVVLFIKAKKKSAGKSPRGIQREPTKDLSRILRTDAAIEAIERKANSGKHTGLWPKAVLEALDDAIRGNQWELALKIFRLLRKQHWYEPRCQTYTKLLVMLGKCRQPEQASLLFEIMQSDGLRPSIDVYTALMSSYGYSGLLDEALRIIDDMKSVSECKPDVYAYSILINCCSKYRHFDLIDQILGEMLFLGIECSIVTYNTIIDGYGKAAMFEQMESLLTDMIETGTCLPDIFTFNSFIGAYGNRGKIEKMEKWFDEFQHMGVEPDIKTLNILIKSYGKEGMYGKIDSIMEFMRKRFYSPTTVTFNIIIEAFGNAENIKKMEEIFLKMKHQGMKPNSITYCSLVKAYSKAGILDKVDSIMRQIENSDVALDTPFFNCIISAYGQAGNIEKMGELFMKMKERKCKPNHTTFATMIQAYSALGMTEAAKDLHSKMIAAKTDSGTKLMGLPT